MADKKRIRGDSCLPDILEPTTLDDLKCIDEAAENTVKENNKKHPHYLQVIELLENKVSTFQSPDEEPYVYVKEGDVYETWQARSSQFKKYFIAIFFREKGRVLNKETIDKVREYYCSMAGESGVICMVYKRVAFVDNVIFYDLANDKREVVAINHDGWQITTTPPVKFVRKKGMLPNVTPSISGDIFLTQKYLNYQSIKDWYLMMGFLLNALFKKPFVILILNGAQGTGKSSTAKVLSFIIDPSSSPLNSKSRNERDLFITSSNCHLMNQDNLSSLSTRISDVLCGISTGTAMRARMLYHDDEEKIFEVSNPIILNGIVDIATNGDLIRRAVISNLPTIDGKNRVTEEKFWNDFEADRPKIMGGVFDALAVALKNRPNIHLETKPYMPDFALFACAASEALGITPEIFMEAYNSNIKEANRNILDLDPVALAIINFMKNRIDPWEGTMTDLKEELFPDEFVLNASKYLPQTPQALSNKVKRLAPMLLSADLIVEKLPREAGTGQRPYRIYKINHSDPDLVVTCDDSDNCDDGLSF